MRYAVRLILFTAILSLRAFAVTQERFEYTELHMGVAVKMIVYAASSAQAEKACRAAFARFAALEQIMSDYRPDSELMRLCDQAGGKPVKVSKELFFVLEKAVEFSHRSGGAFDVTVGQMVKLWRESRKSGKLPTEEALSEAKRLVGWQKIKLDSRRRTVQLTTPGMKLDLGGIAKGYACDEAIAILRNQDIRSALVQAGGDIVMSDAPPKTSGWKIESAAGSLLFLSNCAVSTSGDTVQFVEIEGKRYSHIVDPRTGLGLTSHLFVTVIAPKGIVSDGLTKVISVLGEETGVPITKLYKNVTVRIRSN